MCRRRKKFKILLQKCENKKYENEKCVEGVKMRCFFKAPPVEPRTINCWQVQRQNIVVNIRGRTQGMAQETEIFVNFNGKYLWIFTNNCGFAQSHIYDLADL